MPFRNIASASAESCAGASTILDVVRWRARQTPAVPAYYAGSDSITYGELTDAMDFEIDWFAHVRPQRDESRTESLSMAHLEDRFAFFGGSDHAVRFFQSYSDRFFNEDVNSGFKQACGNLAM